jgi:hypothetical protein
MLHAEFSLAPLLVLVAFFVVSNLAKKKRQQGTPRRPELGGTPEPEPRAGFMTELRRAMEELQQVQQQQQQQPPPPTDGWQTPQASQIHQTPQEKIAAAWLAKQQQRKALAPQGRMRVARPVVPLEDDDADKSSENVVSLEGRDYDDDIERTIAARRQAAEHRVVRVDETSEGLSTLQQARRASRQDVAIGGTAEHSAWHAEIGKTGETVKTVKTATRLGKFADGSARSAIILGEILRPPVGQRDP